MLLAGGAVVYSCCMQTVYNILHEYRIHNAEVLFRDDCSMDEFIDVIEGNRKYVRCLYVWNKVRRGRRTKKKAWGQGGWAAAWSCRGCVPSLRWCCRLPAYLLVVARFCLPQSIWIRRTSPHADRHGDDGGRGPPRARAPLDRDRLQLGPQPRPPDRQDVGLPAPHARLHQEAGEEEDEAEEVEVGGRHCCCGRGALSSGGAHAWLLACYSCASCRRAAPAQRRTTRVGCR